MDRDRALSLLDSYARTRLDARALHPLLLELAEVLDRAPTQVMDGHRALHADHMNLRYTEYPDFRCRPSCLWNLGLVPRDQWVQDMISPWFPGPPWCRGSVRWSPACPPNWPRSRWSGSTEPSGCTIRNTNASTWRSRGTESGRRRRSSKANSGPDHSTPDTRKMTSTRPTRCCSQAGLKWPAKESEVPIRMPARPAV